MDESDVGKRVLKVVSEWMIQNFSDKLGKRWMKRSEWVIVMMGEVKSGGQIRSGKEKGGN